MLYGPRRSPQLTLPLLGPGLAARHYARQLSQANKHSQARAWLEKHLRATAAPQQHPALVDLAQALLSQQAATLSDPAQEKELECFWSPYCRWPVAEQKQWTELYGYWAFSHERDRAQQQAHCLSLTPGETISELDRRRGESQQAATHAATRARRDQAPWSLARGAMGTASARIIDLHLAELLLNRRPRQIWPLLAAAQGRDTPSGPPARWRPPQLHLFAEFCRSYREGDRVRAARLARSLAVATP